VKHRRQASFLLNTEDNRQRMQNFEEGSCLFWRANLSQFAEPCVSSFAHPMSEAIEGNNENQRGGNNRT